MEEWRGELIMLGEVLTMKCVRDRRIREGCLWIGLTISAIVAMMLLLANVAHSGWFSKMGTIQNVDKVLPGSFNPYPNAKYIGDIKTNMGIFACYLSTDRDITRILCKRYPKFIGMQAEGFVDRERMEIWGAGMDMIYYHVDLTNDPIKWKAEQESDDWMIRQHKLERWMKERW